MNRAVSGTVVVGESGRPVSGLEVVAARVTEEGLEVLGGTLSGDYGHFRIAYAPLPEAADLTLLVFAPSGRLLFTEPIHRAVLGAELNLQVQVPGCRLTTGMN